MKSYFNLEILENAAFKEGIPKKEDIEDIEKQAELGSHMELVTLPRNCSLESIV